MVGGRQNLPCPVVGSGIFSGPCDVGTLKTTLLVCLSSDTWHLTTSQLRLTPESSSAAPVTVRHCQCWEVVLHAGLWQEQQRERNQVEAGRPGAN
jgi:hypothetical protein